MRKPSVPKKKQERKPSLKELRERATFYAKNLATWRKQREIIPMMARSARAHIFAAYKAEGLEAAREVYESYRSQRAFDEVNNLLKVEPMLPFLS